MHHWLIFCRGPKGFYYIIAQSGISSVSISLYMALEQALYPQVFICFKWIHFISLFSLWFTIHAQELHGFISLKDWLVLKTVFCYHLLNFHCSISLVLLWLNTTVVYAQPLEGNWICHLLDLKVLIPAHPLLPTSLVLHPCPVASEVHALGSHRVWSRKWAAA